MVKRQFYVEDAFPEWASACEVDLNVLKDQVLRRYGYDVVIRVPGTTRPRADAGSFSKIPVGTVLKPRGATVNYRESAEADPWDITFFADGSWTMEIDRWHPLSRPAAHWLHDLSWGEKVAVAASAVICGVLLVGAVRTVSGALKA